MTTVEKLPSATFALKNVNPERGAREEKTDNVFGLWGLDHFALPARDLLLMERFVREFLGGEAYYYAGFDDYDRGINRKPHLFVRIGNTLLQCTEETGPSTPQADDPNIAPHWAFRTTAEGLDANIERLKREGIPFFGPMAHRDIEVVSVYFRSPEGHKLEICTWNEYPEAKTKMMGAPGVGFIPWKELMHHWPNNNR
ncbi:VOC family protein [Neorhizobium sp. T7_12]|uniref:VOC family protein n=1 Tax=Neorhizobium sp. T7_12 TaxID=2093832 RepID=UPI000CF8C78D|nr:VOC family protein [Neorhizobium sp. T7_12]